MIGGFLGASEKQMFSFGSRVENTLGKLAKPRGSLVMLLLALGSFK